MLDGFEHPIDEENHEKAVNHTAKSSGYVNCACRDCFEIAISGDDGGPALCLACEDAGCLPDTGECQREYDEELEQED